MSVQIMFVGGSKNGQYLDVEEPALTQKIGQEQYILAEVEGQEVYALVELCYREIKSYTKTLWKRQGSQQAPTQVEELPVNTVEAQQEWPQNISSEENSSEDDVPETL